MMNDASGDQYRIPFSFIPSTIFDSQSGNNIQITQCLSPVVALIRELTRMLRSELRIELMLLLACPQLLFDNFLAFRKVGPDRTCIGSRTSRNNEFGHQG